MTNTSSDTNEEQALNAALEEATPLLAESLQRAEQTRLRKRRLLFGGLVMLVIAASIVASMVLSAGEPHTVPDKDQGNTVSIEQFEEVVESEALAQKGWQLWSERKYAEAAQQFVVAIKADPDSPNLWNGLGWSLIHTGQHEKAADAFHQCLILDENWQAATNGLGQIAYAQRDYEQAEAWFLKAPNASAAQHTLVSVHLLTGDYEKAEELSAKLLQEFPESTQDVSILTQRARLAELNAAAASKALPDAIRQKIEPSMPTRPKAKDDPKPGLQPNAKNLLSNGGFEQSTKGWIIGSNSGRMTLTSDKQIKAEGNQSLRITKTGGMPIDIVRINFDDMTPGQKVSVSAKIKSKDAVNAWMKFYIWDTDGNVLIESLDVAHIHGTFDWRTAKKRFTIPDNAHNAAIQFWFVMGAEVWIDDVRIESVQTQADEVIETAAPSAE